ncbi:MAG: FHA domain-containing protein [Zavarzinella sp.]
MVPSPFYLRSILAPFLRISLFQGVVTLGRSSNANIVVADKSVSRRHAEFKIIKSDVAIRDLDSRNGTYLDGVRIKTGVIGAGQIIRFGLISFYVDKTAAQDEDTFDSSLPKSKTNRCWKECESGLTNAQARVLILLLEGYSEIEIGLKLHISRHTVHNHARAIYLAFDVHSRSQLMAFHARQL